MSIITLNADKIFTLSTQQLVQTTLIYDDAFLSYFAESYIQNANVKTAKHRIRLQYQPSKHLEISTQLSSQDLFQTEQFHILIIKGTDLKYEPLKNLLEANTKPLLLQITKLSPAQRKTKLFQHLKKNTTLIETKTLSEKKILLWTQELLNYHQIQISPRLIEPLCQKLDWDLTGILQLVQQITTHQINQINTLETITPLILTTHQAPVFSLIDQLFNGKVDSCVTFFQTYQQSEILQKIYWISMRRLQTYLQLQESLATQACSITTILQQVKIWLQLQPQYRRALKITPRVLQNLYRALCEKE